MISLSIKNFGRIKEGNIVFGDLTVFVGPQATGKTLVLELIKLVKDYKYILKNLYINGFIWENEREFSNLFFGEGFFNLFGDNTQIIYDNLEFRLKEDSYIYIRKLYKKSVEEFFQIPKNVYYIPAQRVLTIENGFPKNFQNYEKLAPYVLKEFSEDLRNFLDILTDSLIEYQDYISSNIRIYPEFDKLMQFPLTKFLSKIFPKATLEISSKELKRRLVLNLDGINLSFLSWSSGQKEFIPMYLGFLRLVLEKNIKIVIIEEPEMGLHPKALETVLLMILYLLYLDYKVIISTHSSDVLELIWGLKNIKESSIEESKKIELLSKLFEINEEKEFKEVLRKVLNKTYKTYYFEPVKDNVFIRDISDLDPFGDKATSEWGGLISFSTKVSDIISQLPYED